MAEPLLIQKPQVVKLEYTLSIDGEIVDRTHEGEAVTILTGHARNLPPSLEGLLLNRAPGAFTASVPARDGYGEYDPAKRQMVTRADLPIPEPSVGLRFSAQDASGLALEARVMEIDGDAVTLELNHPRAGKTLEYAVTIHMVRDADAEEVEHGHVHGEGGVVHTHSHGHGTDQPHKH